MWRCLLRVLCPVRRPITTLDCVLLRDNSLVLVAIRGPEINYRACLLSASKTLPQCHVLFIHPARNFLLYTLPRASQGRLRSNKIVNGILPCELIANFISTYSRMSGDPKESHWVISGDIIHALWHCRTNGDVVLAACKAFRAAWLSEQILMYFSDLTLTWIS
jgi:hypothetical protein